MDGFWDVSVIVEGALDASETFTDPDVMNRYVEDQARLAKNDELWTEVFVQYHGHPMFGAEGEAIECECVQYETDHRPEFEWNVR